MDFSDALRAVKDGKRVRRAMWSEHEPLAGIGLTLDVVTTATGESFSQLLCDWPSGSIQPFSRSDADLLADDWEVA